jgi:hypothetical protein
MLIAMTVFALTFGYYANAIRKNVVAIAHLRARGFVLSDRLIDPIGPNVLYRLASRHPEVWRTEIRSSRIIDRFRGWFGVVGYNHIWAEGITVTVRDADRLSQVPYVRRLMLSKCKLPLEAVERIVELDGLKEIVLEGTSITPAGLAMLRERLPECEVEIFPYGQLSAAR